MAKCTKCSKLDKTAIVEAIQGGISDPDGPAVQTINAQISGFIPALADDLSTISQFGYGSGNPNFFYDTEIYPVIPEILDPISEACGTGDNETSVIGTLVIDPNLPPGSSSVFDLQFTPTNTSAGMGAAILFCPSTGEYTAPQGSYGGTVGQVTTITLDASTLNCSIEDVLVGFTAFGANGNATYAGNCDAISDEVGAIVAVTPSQCATALDCFEELFGCSFKAMASSLGFVPEDDGANDALDKLLSLTLPMGVYSVETPRGFTWKRWIRGERDQGNEEEFNERFNGPVINGIPSHTDGAPFSLGVETDDRYSPRDNDQTGYDEHELCYWIDNTASATDLQITDTDTRAESIRVYVGCGCSASLTYERYQNPDGGANNPPYNSDGEPIATIKAGCIGKMTVQIHDPGPDFSGFHPETPEGEAIPTYQEKPTATVAEIDYNLCDPAPLSEGQSYTRPEFPCHC